MLKEQLYSIRMRASAGAGHISGAERIVAGNDIEEVVKRLLDRARSKGRVPDQITITVDGLKNLTVRFLRSLDLRTINVHDMSEGRRVAAKALAALGVSAHAAEEAMSLISRGAAPSGAVMRGAMLMDARSGERLEPDQERGVRASRFDYTGDALAIVEAKLAGLGLTHHRTREALALATKVVHGPNVVAELCWSDDPGYTAGYVASLLLGYIRFPHLKQSGDPKGGRVIFVDSAVQNRDVLIRYLQVEPTLINGVGNFFEAIEPADYLNTLVAHQ